MPGHIKKSSGPDPGNICFLHTVHSAYVSLRLYNFYLLEYVGSVEQKIKIIIISQRIPYHVWAEHTYSTVLILYELMHNILLLQILFTS
jgi:hypothetical protein